MAGLQPQLGRAVLALVLGLTAATPCAGLAAGLDARLFGAWASSAADCQKLFVRNGGALTYRRPVDQFAQAVIIEPSQIRSPTGVCRIVSVGRDKNGVVASLDCQDSISFRSETVHFKIRNGAEIVYSPTGDTSLDTTYLKCRL